MEITLTVHLPRRRPHPVDVVVQWSGRTTATELCAALADHLGEPVPWLSSRGQPVRPDAVVGMPPLLQGASVAVGGAIAPAAPGLAAPAEPLGVLDLVVVGGPDAGRSHPLSPPGLAVGRAVAGGLVVDDEGLSRDHVFLRVGPRGVTVEDRGSTNGVTVDGVPADTWVTVDAASTLVIGSTTLKLRRAGGAGPPVRYPGDGTVRVSPAAGSSTSCDDVEICAPAPPPERHRARVPWLAAVAPLPIAIVLAAFLGPQLLLFAALGPFSLVAGALGDRWGSARARRRELASHAAADAGARARLAAALRIERERLDRAHPDPAAVLAIAERRLGGLWSGRGTARVRLGLGEVPTRVAWVEGNTRSRPAVERAPVVVDLAELGCLGVVGPPATTDGLLAGLVGQLCTANAPHDLSLWVASTDPGWAWTTRLPHVADEPMPSAAAGPSSPARERPGGPAGGGPLRLLVVPAPASGTSQLVRDALAGGVIVLAAASSHPQLPAGCRAVLHRVDGQHLLEGPAGPVRLVPDQVGPWWVDRLSRALAPLRCADTGTAGRMPLRLTLTDALGGAEITALGVARAWSTRPVEGGRSPAAATPSAVVGATPDGPFVIDLCRDGPHMLVGGTTGSGKSEFLRTLVTSLALSTPPEELSFVLVDFKGGAAFGPCAELPHVVGLVTDLDDHLVSRALASLRAELRRRERVLARVGASDLAAYRRLRTADAEPVPRLVVVVDELRALVEELPEFVTGLVRLAALGRSLGVHLVLATQRPSGALGAEVQANVSLRIAFRMRDRADSVDVLDDGAAASIQPGTPGRALARGADGSLVSFQAATVAAPPSRCDARLTVRAAAVGARPTTPAASAADDTQDAASSATVAAVRDAHRLRGGLVPRSPWMAPLPAVVTAASAAGAAVVASGGPEAPDAAGVVGLVDEPDLQQMTPLRWHATDGCWLLAGGPGSGRTTALRALALGAVRESGPDALHLHAIAGHASLADLGALPHLGTSARTDDLRACAALVEHLRDEVDRRLGAARPDEGGRATSMPTVLVLVDGWDQLVEAHPTHGSEHLTGTLLRLLRDGRSVGVVGAVTGGRSLLHPRWGEVAGRTFLLGSVDPLDAALAGLRATDVPRDPPPGRAVRVHDRREVQFTAMTTNDTAAAAQTADPRPAAGAWRWTALPVVVHRRDAPLSPAWGTGERDWRSGAVLLGLGGTDGGTHSVACCWRPETDGRRLLVVGPPGSGRSNALRAVAQSLCGTGRPVVIVESQANKRRMPCPTGPAVISPGDTAALVRLRREHPHLAVCVDDCDRLGDSPLVPLLREIVELVDRDDGLVVVSTSSTALATRFSGIDVEMARSGCGVVLNPSAAERLLGSPATPEGIPRLPGRGVFISHGRAMEVQVLLADSSVGQVPPGEHLGVGVPSHPGRADDHDGYQEHQPAHRHPAALDQADADREQQGVPDDGGGARP